MCENVHNLCFIGIHLGGHLVERVCSFSVTWTLESMFSMLGLPFKN